MEAPSQETLFRLKRAAIGVAVGALLGGINFIVDTPQSFGERTFEFVADPALGGFIGYYCPRPITDSYQLLKRTVKGMIHGEQNPPPPQPPENG